VRLVTSFNPPRADEVSPVKLRQRNSSAQAARACGGTAIKCATGCNQTDGKSCEPQVGLIRHEGTVEKIDKALLGFAKIAVSADSTAVYRFLAQPGCSFRDRSCRWIHSMPHAQALKLL
jgi:hypothetical protein